MELAERLGIRIRYLRELKGITQKELCASSTSLKQPYLSQIEKGKVWVRIDTIEIICRGLRVTPEELFRGVFLG
jgi:transcriptional regulator with XRE-family HTH domain